MKESGLFVSVLIVIVAAYFLSYQDFGGKPASGSYLTAEEYRGAGNQTEYLSFSDLTQDQQEVFVRELESENRTLIPGDVSIQAWIENTYVRYRGEVYRIAVAQN